MIRFDCDYLEGAHPLILKKLSETNMQQSIGYGCDEYCDNAKKLIKDICDSPESDVHFLIGGTQTNTTVICAALRPHQGVISAETGHINIHESGAIEATGHKVLALPAVQGKLCANQLDEYLTENKNDPVREHMVQPGMVYISFPTEGGTLYSKQELTDIYSVCRKHGIPLYIDGARLGYGLAAETCDVDITDFSKLCDVFYIGGTKVGALFGEALVINSNSLKKDFRYIIKQKGGLLAKGRLLGIQFEALFENGLYFEISKHAINCAKKIRKIFEDNGCDFLFDSETNQQFPILPDGVIDLIFQKCRGEIWCSAGKGKSAVRFCSSWATTNENLDVLEKTVSEILK